MTLEAAAFVLGLAGSGHCVSMCGPLILGTSSARLPSQAAYHSGRVLLYAGLGAAAGATGNVVAAPEWRSLLALMAGVVVVWVSLTRTRWFPISGLAGSVGRRMTQVLGLTLAWVRRHRLGGPLILGGLNGLLPCGWLYAALAAAAGLAEPAAAGRFMAAFGLGTVPALVAFRFLPGRTLPSTVLRRAAPWVSAAVGVLLIARGLNIIHANHGSLVHVEPRIEQGMPAAPPPHSNGDRLLSHTH